MAKKIWSIDLALVTVSEGKMAGTVSLMKDGMVEKDFELDLSEAITGALAKHGIKQKMADNYAGLEKKGGTVEDHIEAVEKVVNMLNKGMFKTSKTKEAAVTLKGAIAKALTMDDVEGMLKLSFMMFGATFDQKLVDKVKAELEELEDDNEE